MGRLYGVHRPMRLVTKSDDGSRLWIDLNHDGVFASSGTELIANGWGQAKALPLATPA